MSLSVVIEATPRRAFASAIDWPGWARAAKTPDEAVQALLDRGHRYAPVASRAGVAFHPPRTLRGVEIIERLPGSGSTEFGVPAAVASAERDPLPPGDLRRLSGLLEAAWATFDAVADAAAGTSLTLGPRGGGRQVAAIVEHVRGAESAYLHQLGWKVREPEMQDLRRAFLEALRLRAADEPLPEPNKVRAPWPPRYAIRRSAWHALDHAWEIEDRRPPSE